MMKSLIAGCVAAATLVSLADGVKVAFPAGNQKNYEKNTKVAVGADAGKGNDFVVTCTSTSRCETAWQIVSEKMPLPTGTAGFAFDFEIQADADWLTPGTSDSWGSAVTWYGAKGEKVAKRPFDVAFRKGKFARFRFSGEVPEKAASATVEIGVDGPNLPPGEKVVVRNATFTTVPRGSAIPPQIVYDVTPPLVYSRFASPSPDPNLAVKYEVVDDGEIDWDAVTVSNVGAKVAVPFARNGNVITLKPGRPWSKGINTLVVSAKDKDANATVSRKAFLIGERSKAPTMRLRDDGMALVDGKPFFPIGIYGVKLLEFNAWDFDRAVGDLKAVGFNLVHSYTHARKEEFQSAVRKHGLLSWTYAFGAAKGDAWLVDKSQTDPSILAWYTGDDTSMHIKPSELLDRDEAVHMLDGTRLSCQADVTGGDQMKSRYQPYVAFSDVFMPELYHVLSENPAADRPCVARVIRDMEKAKDDIAKYSGGKPRALWPILQIFHGGRLWHRFPTADEIYGMSFAALVHGGNGITWFHYAGQIDREHGRRYSGAFQSQETWAVMTNLSTRIASLSPVLLERTPQQPAAPEILSGEKTDHYGRPSVSVLVKNHKGMTYVLAVNASSGKVRARIFASVPDGEGKVAWENRRVAVSGGAFEDDFNGFGVHVYRFANALKPFPRFSPARAITKGPHDHFLANYFGINAWSPDNRYVLALETDIKDTLPDGRPCTLGVVDTEDNNRFIPVTTTRCWNFQEAAMAHWLPWAKDTFVFNDVRDGKFCAVVMNWRTKEERHFPFPVSAVAENGEWGLSINYARLFITRPDYGYAGDGQDPRAGVVFPEDDGLWRVNMRTGEAKLIVSCADVKGMVPAVKSSNGLSYICHTVISKDFNRVYFLSRSVERSMEGVKKFRGVNWHTTAFTCNADGTGLRRCFPDGWGSSHFNWRPNLSPRDAATMIVTCNWQNRVYTHVEFTVGEEEKARQVGGDEMNFDGHCIYTPDGDFISGDGYWDGKFYRHWKMVRLADSVVKSIGDFFVPEPYRDVYCRCDLHPRWRPDGKQLGFNSVHEGSRQIYVMDVE